MFNYIPVEITEIRGKPLYHMEYAKTLVFDIETTKKLNYVASVRDEFRYMWE